MLPKGASQRLPFLRGPQTPGTQMSTGPTPGRSQPRPAGLPLDHQHPLGESVSAAGTAGSSCQLCGVRGPQSRGGRGGSLEQGRARGPLGPSSPLLAHTHTPGPLHHGHQAPRASHCCPRLFWLIPRSSSSRGGDSGPLRLGQMFIHEFSYHGSAAGARPAHRRPVASSKARAAQ